ncbi:MAG: DUF2723 domain-containing protein [Candidatus Kapabacteria bacterium]|nr:DUF2723 domain-containing protein [Candidatus Kapabacteria bacterium]
MDMKTLHRIFAAASFTLAAIVYLMTVQPTVPFWDCGEFSSAAIWQQVPHPPGTPVFLLIGNVFHTLIPFGDSGWRVNLAAVFSGAFSVLFMYLITVKVINNFFKKAENMGEAIAIYGSAFVAAAALTFSDTMWFNSVESEVYATSLTFVAAIVWLMMIWNEKSNEPGNERYLLLIAYLIGLSIGVHLLSILTVFSIAMVVYYRKYKFSIGSFLLMTVIAVLVFYLIYPIIVKWIPAFLAGHTAGKSQAREYAIDNSLFLQLVAIGSIIGAAYALFYGMKKKINWLNLAATAFLLMIFGYSTYTQILLRSNANPPMNENEPKDLTRLTSYLGREQYGDAPSWPRRYQTDDMFVRIYNSRDDKGNYVYGEWYPPSRGEARRKDGTAIGTNEFTKINSSGEINYLVKYQMNHMYWRYFGWNFIGRKSDVQDARTAWFSNKSDPDIQTLNYKSGYADQFPVRFFALPLLFGLIGLIFHFKKDPKMAFVYLIMFLLMGVLTALAQNQQDPQPRERDYFYAGSFFVWCIWIGMGAFSLKESLGKGRMTTTIAIPVLILSLLLVPVNMAIGGWKIHSRAGNYLPFDYSYNILQSVEPNAILFTNGDNDTFPLWFIQDVVGVRRDVRVVNLSLGNTLWYVDQLKNRQPWGTDKIPLTFADDSLQVKDEADPKALSYDFGEAINVAIPVKREILEKYTDDPAILADGHFRFKWTGKNYTQMEGKEIFLFRVQDKLILNILQNTRFERPVYFSNTVGPDAYSGLEAFFRYEGMAMRICPVPQNTGNSLSMDIDIMEKSLMNVDNSDNYSTDFKYGFKMRNLNAPSIYYDEVHRRLMNTYRSLYLTYASYMLQNQNQPEKAIAILDKMDELISTEQFPLELDFEMRIAKMYETAGMQEQAFKYADMCIATSMELINKPYLNPNIFYFEALGRRIGPHQAAAYMYELKGEFNNAIEIMNRLGAYMEGIISRGDINLSQQERDQIRYNLIEVFRFNDEMTVENVLASKGKDAAIDTLEKMIQNLSPDKIEDQYRNQALRAKLMQLQEGAQDSTPDLLDF